jgi:hypothetical protein
MHGTYGGTYIRKGNWTRKGIYVDRKKTAENFKSVSLFLCEFLILLSLHISLENVDSKTFVNFPDH